MKRDDKSFQDASSESRTSLASEFVYFLKTNKKWWLTPIILAFALLGLLVLLSGSGVAPFIYTLF
ncbi:MAG: hypothetical protein GY768_06655 [Planctomycetaceae bacterium]|nr:hypothetical protein [Planctomycetaceae bacterium]